MGVAGQIGKNRRRTGERTLGINDPFALAQRCEPLDERLRIGELCIFAEELQPAAVVCGGEFFEETPAEQPRQHAHRQEEARPARDPALTVGG